MELILEDADIITMAPQPGPAAPGPAADSMLVRDGYIIAVGSAAQIRALAARNAAIVPLDGATVIPGLIDAHCHVSDVGYLAAAADCSQPAAPDIPAIVARLRNQVGRTPDGSWVTGAGYVEYKLQEDRHPTRADLDAAVPDRPAVLYHTSLHACVLNSAALREVGFADGQPDPPGGAFGRDEQGRLDGVVFEGPMFALFERNLHHDLGELGPDQRARVVRTAGERLAALGVTAVCEADLRRDSFTAFAEADAAGALHQRIYGLVVHDEVDWLLAAGLRGRRSDRLAAEAVKIWADGGMSSRTAAISGQYPVPPYGSGILYFDPYTAVLPGPPDPAGSSGRERNPRRHRIEHGGALYPELLARAAELNIAIATQPGFFSTLGDGFAAAFPDTCDQLYAIGSWRRAGLTVAGSSDAPVISPDPLLGLRDAVLRRTAGGRVLGPGEELTAASALALYTSQAAYAMHRETEIGSLTVGHRADFVVLDGNPLTIDPERITDLSVLATALDGVPVHQDGLTFPG
jgi:predicted amidohydrolase YtcJ